MPKRLFMAALLAIGSALPFIGNAEAGCCGYCGYYAPYAVQPEVIVSRTFVVLWPYYFNEYVPCGSGYVVNQGQYHTDAALIANPRCVYGQAR